MSQPSTILFQHYILFFLNTICKFLLSSWSPLAWITVIRAGLPNKLFNRLEVPQNSVARIIICTRSIDHITPLLIRFHLICSLFFVLLHTTQVSPPYFHEPPPPPHPFISQISFILKSICILYTDYYYTTSISYTLLHKLNHSSKLHVNYNI